MAISKYLIILWNAWQVICSQKCVNIISGQGSRKNMKSGCLKEKQKKPNNQNDLIGIPDRSFIPQVPYIFPFVGLQLS